MKILICRVVCAAVTTCVSAGAQTLLVANQGNATVSVMNAATGNRTAVIEEKTPGVHGHEIVVAAVTTEMDKSITIVDPHTRKVVGKVPTGAEQSHMFVLSNDGTRGYTANVGPGTVSVLDMVGRRTIAVIPVSGNVQRIAISNDDRWVFTSDQTQPRMAVIDTATRTVGKWIPLPGTGYGAAPTQDGRWLMVCIPAKNQVAVVDLRTMRVAKTIDVPPAPQEILIRPDGAVAYVSCIEVGKVAAIDLANWKVTKVMDAGPDADGLAWAR